MKKLSEQLRQDHESGDFGKALEGYAERAEELEQQNLALAAAIEVKDAALTKLRSHVGDPANFDCYGTEEDLAKFLQRVKLNEDAAIVQADAAIALNPSTDLLAKRDQKRDAALLRATRNTGPIFTTSLVGMAVERIAAARESGEWNPELGVK